MGIALALVLLCLRGAEPRSLRAYRAQKGQEYERAGKIAHALAIILERGVRGIRVGFGMARSVWSRARIT